jgi:hypothetical protein
MKPHNSDYPWTVEDEAIHRVLKLSREELVELLITSWRNHYAVCDDEYLAKEYEQEFDEDVMIVVTGGS